MAGLHQACSSVPSLSRGAWREDAGSGGWRALRHLGLPPPLAPPRKGEGNRDDSFRHHPCCQSRRDRVPDHAHGARTMGYRTAAVYSEADADALHVRMADVAACIGPPEARASYLNIGCDLSRRPGGWVPMPCTPATASCPRTPTFAQACADAGLVFIGPSPAAIAAMGNKAAAKRRMLEAGVPCVPGYQGADQVGCHAGARGGAHRLSGDGEGGGRRRRARHAAGRSEKGFGGGAVGRARGGRERLRFR